MEPGNLLRIESLDDGWCDKDYVLLHACFQLLKDCVEKENLLGGHTDWDVDERFRNAKKEISELYQWWLERMNNNEVEPNTYEMYLNDNAMLHRLIEIRWALWT